VLDIWHIFDTRKHVPFFSAYAHILQRTMILKMQLLQRGNDVRRGADRSRGRDPGTSSDGLPTKGWWERRSPSRIRSRIAQART